MNTQLDLYKNEELVKRYKVPKSSVLNTEIYLGLCVG